MAVASTPASVRSSKECILIIACQYAMESRIGEGQKQSFIDDYNCFEFHLQQGTFMIPVDIADGQC